MDSYRSYWASNLFSGLQQSDKGQEEHTYEVESRVPLPYPFPFADQLDENNSVVVNTSIFHCSHKKNGHRLRVVSKISLPTPPFSVSIKKLEELLHVSEIEMGEKLNYNMYSIFILKYDRVYFAKLSS